MGADFRLRLGARADDMLPETKPPDPAPVHGAGPDPREALRAFGRAAAREPIEPDYDFLVGRALLRAGEPARAAERCADAVRLHRLNPEYHFALGCALWALARHEEAEAAFREAAELAPRDADARNARAATLVLLERPAEAVPELEAVVAAAPRFAEAWTNLGAALWELGRRDEGLRALRRAVRWGPRQPDLRRNLGLALLDLGRAREAVVVLRRAAALSHGRASAFLDLAEAAFDVGRRGEVARALDEATRLDPAAIAARPRSQAARDALRLDHLRGEPGPGRPWRPDLAGLALGALLDAEEALRALLQSRRAGSLLLLAVVLAAATVACNLIPPHVDHYLLQDDLTVVARAPVDDDANVRDRLRHAVRERRMESAVDADRCEVRTRPDWRRITCEYAVPVEILPGWRRTLSFRIDVEQPYVVPTAGR